jgi:hypothetical protein
LNNVGVVTAPIVANPTPHFPGIPMGAGSGSTISQLRSDWQTLLTELQSLASKSSVTVADVESVVIDSQAIAQAGYQFDRQDLKSVVSELATAVAGGTSTAQAQTDFNNLFSGSSVSTTVITNTFNDLVKTITDSGVTTTDLSTVASDEAAIQADLSNLPGHGASPWPGWLQDLPEIPVGLGGTLLVSPALGPVNPIVFEPVFPFVPVGPIAPVFPFIGGPFGGPGLFTSLNYVGVVTGPVLVSPAHPTSSNTQLQQLENDVQTLRAELQSLATKSGVTVAELESLALDSQAITQAGYHFHLRSLNAVMSELAGAVASGSSTSQAQSDFNALFTGSSVTSTVISSTFDDLVKAIGSSHVTTTDLAAVASDEAAIQNDLKNLHGNNGGGSGGSGGSTSGSGNTGHHHKPHVFRGHHHHVIAHHVRIHRRRH